MAGVDDLLASDTHLSWPGQDLGCLAAAAESGRGSRIFRWRDDRRPGLRSRGRGALVAWPRLFAPTWIFIFPAPRPADRGPSGREYRTGRLEYVSRPPHPPLPLLSFPGPRF